MRGLGAGTSPATCSRSSTRGARRAEALDGADAKAVALAGRATTGHFSTVPVLSFAHEAAPSARRTKATRALFMGPSRASGGLTDAHEHRSAIPELERRDRRRRARHAI